MKKYFLSIIRHVKSIDRNYIFLSIFFCSCSFFIIACTNPAKINPSRISPNNCAPYFDFDRVEHYQIYITEDRAGELYDSKRPLDQKFNDALNQYQPDTITNLGLLDDLEEIGYKKRDIDKAYFQQINAIFCERKHTEAYYNSCIAIFRDILVFKKSGKVVGVAKICFTCEQSWIIGTDKNTLGFGMSGDFEKLYQILH